MLPMSVVPMIASFFMRSLLRYLLASQNDMPSPAARVAMINGSHERHDIQVHDYPKHRQCENISASKSFRPHTCGRLGGCDGSWFLRRKLR
jgi:hypothetical protein